MSSKKFAATVSDRYIGIPKAFIEAGWEPLKLFTAPITSHMANNQMVIKLAEQYRIPVQLHRMEERDLADLKNEGCDLLVVGSYQWRIGDWSQHLPRAINFHPAPLPRYRGPYPLVQGILDNSGAWATTCHKLNTELDTGDILSERYFVMDHDECHESLDLKVQIETRQLAAFVAQNMDYLWDTATPQGQGQYIPKWTDADRTINFHQSVEQIDRQLRAFGNFECIAVINGTLHFVRRALCWHVIHDGSPGSIVHKDGTRYVIACKDGFVALLEWNMLPPGFVTESSLRHV